MRVLLWAVIIVALVVWLVYITKNRTRQDIRRDTESGSAHAISEAMVQCAQCGIHIPASEAVLTDAETAFCSEEHRLKYLSS
jgi:uncharacterized protein